MDKRSMERIVKREKQNKTKTQPLSEASTASLYYSEKREPHLKPEKPDKNF